MTKLKTFSSVLFLLILLQAAAPLIAEGTSPTLAINVSLSYPWAYQGESVTVNVLVSNVGGGIADNVAVNLLELPSSVRADFTTAYLGNLAAGKNAQASFVLTTSTSAQVTTYNIQASVAADNVASVKGFATLQIMSPPIEISQFSVSPTAVVLDEPTSVKVNATVTNVANVPVANVTMTVVSSDPTAFAIPNPTQSIGTMNPGASTGIVPFSVNTRTLRSPAFENLTLLVTYTDPTGRRHSLNRSETILFKHSYDILNTGRCIIATATYGSELAPQVQLLRNFRDNKILHTYVGTQFMTAFNAWYYSFSPSVAQVIAQEEPLRNAMKILLYPLIEILQVAVGVFNLAGLSDVGAILTGLIVSALLGAAYLAVPMAVVISRVKRIRRLARKLGLALGLMLTEGAVATAVGTFMKVDFIVLIGAPTLVLATILASGFILAYALLSLLVATHVTKQPQPMCRKVVQPSTIVDSTEFRDSADLGRRILT